MEYDEEQVLTNYIRHNYFGMLTKTEKLAAKAILAEEKASTASERMARMLRRQWASPKDQAVIEALQDGPDAFWREVRERILREEPDEFIINRCPECNRIVRTPEAR